MDALLKGSYNLGRLKQSALFAEHRWNEVPAANLVLIWMSEEFTQGGSESSSYRSPLIKTFRTRIVPLNLKRFRDFFFF